MPRDPLIGLVGKPSSGKSTTLNSLTDATSKVGTCFDIPQSLLTTLITASFRKLPVSITSPCFRKASTTALSIIDIENHLTLEASQQSTPKEQ